MNAPKRKLPDLKRQTDFDEQLSNKRRRAAIASFTPKNGSRKSKASGSTSKPKLLKHASSKTKNSGSAKKKKATRVKKPLWVKSVCSLQTLSVPIITRSMSKLFDSWKTGVLKGPRQDIIITGQRKENIVGTRPICPAAPKNVIGSMSGKLLNAYRPVVTRSRKLQLRQKILNYMHPDCGSEPNVIGPIGGKEDISTQTFNEHSLGLDGMDPSSASGHQILNYRDVEFWRCELDTMGPRVAKEDISTQTLFDDMSYPLQYKMAPSSAGGHQNVSPCSVNLVSLEACVQVDIKSVEKGPTLREQNNLICEKYDLDPDLYRINHSPIQQEPVWINQGSPKATNHCMVTEKKTVDSQLAGGYEQRCENSTIRPSEMLPDLSPHGGQRSPKIFKSSGFRFEPRNSASINLGITFSVPFLPNAPPNGPTSGPGSVEIANKENEFRGMEPKLSIQAAMSSFRSTGNSSSQSLIPGHVTSPYVPLASNISNSRAQMSRRVDKRKISKLRSNVYRCLSPKGMKVLNLGKLKSAKRNPRVALSGCLCCRDNMKHVCKCCLKIRSKLRSKTRRVTPDVVILREPKPVDRLDAQRIVRRKSSLDASMEAAHHVYKKLKEMIRYYGCSSQE